MCERHHVVNDQTSMVTLHNTNKNLD